MKQFTESGGTTSGIGEAAATPDLTHRWRLAVLASRPPSMLRCGNAPKKSQVENRTPKRLSRRKTSLFKRIGIQARAGSRDGRKARKSAIFGLPPTAMARSRQNDFGPAQREKSASRRGVDSRSGRWHSAVTGHAMTVAVGDGRGFSSLAAAPDGRAPAQCTARSWPAGRASATSMRWSAHPFLRHPRGDAHPSLTRISKDSLGPAASEREAG